MRTSVAIDLGNPLRRDHPLARGTAAFWLPLPNLYGSRLFDLAGGNHGTLTNGPTWTAGPNGFGAVGFDGSTQYGTTAVINAQTVYVLDAAVRVNAGAGEGQIICNDNGIGTDRGWQFRMDSSGVLRLIAFSSGHTNGQAAGATDIRGTGWRHVAASWDGSTVRVFLDGREDGSGSLSGPYANTTTTAVTLGGGVSGGNAGTSRLNGSLGYAAIRFGLVGSQAVASALCDLSRRGFPDLLRRRTRRTWVGGAGGGGGTTPVSSSDTGSGADAGSVAATITGTDTGAGTDAGTLTATPTGSDTGSGSEAVGGIALAHADTGSGSEAGSLSATATAADTGSGADAGGAIGLDGQADAGAGSEAGSLAVTLSGSDTATGTETASIAATLTGSDAGTGADAGSVGGSAEPTGSDTGSGSEGWAIVATLTAADAAGGVEVASVAATLTHADSGAGADGQSLFTGESAGTDLFMIF